MSTDKKEKKMTEKMFLHRSGTRAANSASAFISANRDFLLTGKLAQVTHPIIERIDSGSLMPTPGLQEIRNAVLNHMLNQEVEAAKKALEIQEEQGSTTGGSNPYTATILDVNGNVCTKINDKGEEVRLIKSFNDGEHGRNWCDLRLFEGASDWHGEITHQSITIKGEQWKTIVERPDSIARLLKKKKSAITTQPRTTTSRLGFGSKVKQDRASFSRG